MGRIRTIKPEFPQSESMGRISRDARLMFVQLWTLVDDSGRARAASRMLASLLFPYDDDAPDLIDGWLDELEREGCLIRYEVNGSHYLQVCNWRDHQRIDRPTPSKFPPLANPREDSRGLDVGSGTKDQGPRKVQAGGGAAAEPPSVEPEKQQAKPQKRPVEKPDGVADEIWQDWIAHRRAKKATVTQTAVDGIAREAAKARMSLDEALRHSIAQGWQGFRADWLKTKDQQRAEVGKSHAPQPTRHNSDLDIGDDRCDCLSCRAARRDRRAS